MYNWYILKSISRYWSQICHYLISNLFTCNFLSINIKFLQQDRLFSKEKCFGTKRHLLQNRYDDRSADVTLTILSRTMLEILIGCWKIAGEYVISNRITFLTMTVTGHVIRWLDFTSLKAQLPAGFHLLFSLSINNHRCMSSSAFHSLSLSLFLFRKREGMVGIFMAIRTFFSDLSLSFHDSCETRSRESRFFFTANRTNFRFSDFSENLYTLYTRSREDEDSRQNIGRTTKKRRRNTERWKTRTEDPWTRERKYLEGGRSGRKIERKKGRVGVCERRRDRRKCW